MLALQCHLRSPLQYFENILFVVLAAKAEEHASVVLPDHEFLDGSSRRINLHTQRTIFPAHSSPQGPIAIKHNDFGAGAVQGRNLPRDHSSQGSEEHRIERDMSQLVS